MPLLKDGFSTTITFSEAPAVKMEEKSVTPPGVDGGGENDTSTMRNTAWRTRQPRSLKTATEMSFEAAYDPAVYDDIISMVNVNQQITVNWPDGSTLTFWGWLNTFEPGELVEGEQPTASVTIIPSNQDNSGVEQPPVYAAPGT